MFVDPASISSGWAIFINQDYFVSGSVVVKGKDAIERLVRIYSAYKELAGKWDVSEVHLEQFGGRPSHILHWSVGVIGVALKTDKNTVAQDVPVSSWQLAAGWKGTRAPLKVYMNSVQTEDELAAIGMGIWYTGVNR
jgi:hypothetical protein